MLSIKQYLFATHKPASTVSLPTSGTNDRFCKPTRLVVKTRVCDRQDFFDGVSGHADDYGIGV